MDTDTDFLSDFHARMSERNHFLFSLPRAGHARRSLPTCPTCALFLARILARMSVTCTVHDNLSCTCLQNYTIGASIMSVLVPWNSTLTGAEVYKVAHSCHASTLSGGWMGWTRNFLIARSGTTELCHCANSTAAGWQSEILSVSLFISTLGVGLPCDDALYKFTFTLHYITQVPQHWIRRNQLRNETYLSSRCKP